MNLKKTWRMNAFETFLCEKKANRSMMRWLQGNACVSQKKNRPHIPSTSKFPWPTLGGLAELWVHNCWQKRIFGPNLPKGVKHDNNLAVFEIVCRISGSFPGESGRRETDVFISQPFWPQPRGSQVPIIQKSSHCLPAPTISLLLTLLNHFNFDWKHQYLAQSFPCKHQA